MSAGCNSDWRLTPSALEPDWPEFRRRRLARSLCRLGRTKSACVCHETTNAVRAAISPPTRLPATARGAITTPCRSNGTRSSVRVSSSRCRTPGAKRLTPLRKRPLSAPTITRFSVPTRASLEDRRGSGVLSRFHSPHRYTLFTSYSLPWFSTRSDFVGQTLGGWKVSMVAKFAAGTPFTVSNSNGYGDFNFDGFGEIRPVIVDPSIL